MVRVAIVSRKGQTPTEFVQGLDEGASGPCSLVYSPLDAFDVMESFKHMGQLFRGNADCKACELEPGNCGFC